MGKEEKRKGGGGRRRRLPWPLLSQVEMAVIEVGPKAQGPQVHPRHVPKDRHPHLPAQPPPSVGTPRRPAEAGQGWGTQARQAGQAAPSHLPRCLQRWPGLECWLATAPGTGVTSFHLLSTPPTGALQLTPLKLSSSPFPPGPERLSPPCHQGHSLSSLIHPPHPSITRPRLAPSSWTVLSRSKERAGLLLPVPASLPVSALGFPAGPGSSPPGAGIRHHFLDFVVKSLSHGRGERNSLQMERDPQRTKRGGRDLRPGEGLGGSTGMLHGGAGEVVSGSEGSKNTGAMGDQRFLAPGTSYVNTLPAPHPRGRSCTRSQALLREPKLRDGERLAHGHTSGLCRDLNPQCVAPDPGLPDYGQSGFP